MFQSVRVHVGLQLFVEFTIMFQLVLALKGIMVIHSSAVQKWNTYHLLELILVNLILVDHTVNAEVMETVLYAVVLKVTLAAHQTVALSVLWIRIAAWTRAVFNKDASIHARENVASTRCVMFASIRRTAHVLKGSKVTHWSSAPVSRNQSSQPRRRFLVTHAFHLLAEQMQNADLRVRELYAPANPTSSVALHTAAQNVPSQPNVLKPRLASTRDVSVHVTNLSVGSTLNAM